MNRHWWQNTAGSIIRQYSHRPLWRWRIIVKAGTDSWESLRRRPLQYRSTSGGGGCGGIRHGDLCDGRSSRGSSTGGMLLQPVPQPSSSSSHPVFTYLLLGDEQLEFLLPDDGGVYGVELRGLSIVLRR